MKHFIFTQILFLSLMLGGATVYGQQVSPTPDEVVKVSTELVQVDAVVTDKDGKQITDLTAGDFELLQDGKPQKITNLSYVTRASQTFKPVKRDKNSPLPPPSPSKTNEFGRVITFIVDDGNCDSTLGGMVAAREGLEKFIREQMQPNDVVAIYQTKSGSKLIQQYTSDKNQLLSIAKKIRWGLWNSGCSTYGADQEQQTQMGDLMSGDSMRRDSISRRDQPSSGASNNSTTSREFSDNLSNRNQIIGSIGVLRYVINGLRQVGGRKLVFYLSDSLRLDDGRGRFYDSVNAIRDLTALANRASVVINTVDVRGLIAPGGASSGVSGSSIPEPEADGGSSAGYFKQIANSRTARENGLVLIANETGGKFYTNQNFLDNPIRQALKSETGYYLLAYEPDDEIFKGKKFHKIEVKLKRSGLNVSSRSGFFGVTDKELEPKPRTGDGELYEALIAPLPNADVETKLSAYFVNKNAGNAIRTLLHIKGQDIKFVDDTNGMKKVSFDVIAVTMDEKGKVIDEFNRAHTVRLPQEYITRVEQTGLTYTADVPVKKEGTYTFRIALRESTNNRIGSASQVVEIPELKKGRFLVSGFIVGNVDAAGKMETPEETKAENAFAPVISTGIPAVRQFRRNTILKYLYTIHNAKLNKDNQPALTIQTNLYYNGNLISEGSPQPAQLEKQTDLSSINDFGYMKLNPAAQPGDYTLQIIVKDLQGNRTDSQWIDFEVIE